MSLYFDVVAFIKIFKRISSFNLNNEQKSNLTFMISILMDFQSYITEQNVLDLPVDVSGGIIHFWAHNQQIEIF